MRLRYLTVILLVFFVLEGALLPWLIPPSWQSAIFAIPGLTLIGVVYTALYAHRYAALTYGLVFGMMQDVVYGANMLGPHSFALGLIGYLTGLLVRRTPPTLGFTLYCVSLASLFNGLSIYGIYILFRVISLPIEWTLLHDLLPRLLMNLLVALVLFMPSRALYERIQVKEDPEEAVGS